MMDEILLGLFTDFLYDLIKTGVKLTADELSKRTSYSYNDCQHIVSLIEPNSINSKDDLQKQLDKTTIIKDMKNDYYKTNFSIRLDYIINKIKEYIPNANTEWLCNKLGFTSSNVLLKYYKQSEEPTFQFIDELSNNLGIRQEWLRYGEDNRIFATVHLHIDRKLLDYIKSNKINTIYFAFYNNSLSNYSNSELIMIFKFNELKYVVNICQIPFGSYVGGEGMNTICKFYVFLLWLNKNRHLNNCKTVSVSNNVIGKLVSGELYGKAVENLYYNKGSLGEFISDFVCTHSNYLTIEQKLEFYGQSFLDCQEIIKNNKSLIEKIKEDMLDY